LCYSKRHVRRLIAKNTITDLDTTFEPTPSCSYHVFSIDENSLELISQNQNDNTNMIPKPSTDSDDSNDYIIHINNFSYIIIIYKEKFSNVNHRS